MSVSELNSLNLVQHIGAKTTVNLLTFDESINECRDVNAERPKNQHYDQLAELDREIQRLDFHRRVWKKMTIGTLILTLGAGFVLAGLFYLIQVHYENKIQEKSEYNSQRVKTAMRNALAEASHQLPKDLERETMISIDGITYGIKHSRDEDGNVLHHDLVINNVVLKRYVPEQLPIAKAALTNHIIGQLQKKMQGLALILALRLVHQGGSSLANRHLVVKMGAAFPVQGANYQRHIKIFTKGNQAKMFSSDKFLIMARDDRTDDIVRLKCVQTDTTLNLKNRKVMIRCSESELPADDSLSSLDD